MGTIQHAKTSTVPAPADATRINGVDWNEPHDFNLEVADINGLQEQLIPLAQVQEYRDQALAAAVSAGESAIDAAESAAAAAAELGAAVKTVDLAAATGAGLVGVTGGGNLQVALDARPTSATLAMAGAADTIGTAAGTVQDDLDARPLTANLAAVTGAGLVGYSLATAYSAGTLGYRFNQYADATNAVHGAYLVGYLSSLPGATGRPVAYRLDDEIHLSDFPGADPTGVADSTAAINLALAAAAVIGGVVKLRRGSYKHTGFTMPANTAIKGNGYSTILNYTPTTGDAITMGSATRISDVGLTYQGTPTAGTMIRMMGNAARIDNCEFTKYFVGVVFGDLATIVVGPVVRYCNFRSPTIANGTGAIFAQHYSNGIIEHNIIAGPAWPAVQPDFGIRMHNGDTAFLTNNNVTLHGYGLLMDVPAGLNNYATRISGCLFDSARTVTGGAVVASGRIAPAGSVKDMLVVNTWFGLSQTGSGLDITTTGAGVVDGVGFDNCQFVDNEDAGLALLSTAVKNVIVNGGYASANTVYGFRAAAGVGDFTLMAFRAGNIAARGVNGRGINFDTGAGNRIVMIGCVSFGNTVFNFFNGATGVNNVIPAGSNYTP